MSKKKSTIYIVLFADRWIVICWVLFEFVVAYPVILFLFKPRGLWYFIDSVFSLVYKLLSSRLPLFFMCYVQRVVCVTIQNSFYIYVVSISKLNKLVVYWCIHSVYFSLFRAPVPETIEIFVSSNFAIWSGVVNLL